MWCPFTSIAQFEQGDFVLSATAAETNYNDFALKTSYGLDMQYFVDDNVSLNYSFRLGERYAHVPAAAPASAIMLFIAFTTANNGDTEVENKLTGWGIISGIALALVPEGVSFHLRVNDHLAVSPYINPLGLEWIREEGVGGRDTWLGGSAGAKGNLILGDFVVAPYGEYKKLYGRKGNWGTGAGIAIGYRFQ